jgi:hypothetical protein
LPIFSRLIYYSLSSQSVSRKLTMDEHACNMFKFQSCQTSEYCQSCLYDLNANAETISMDEESIDDELEKLNKLQSAINNRRTLLQTAKDKTAKPWNLGISCTMHADLRKGHVCDNRRSLESLVCSACKECAFCDPKYGACWPSSDGNLKLSCPHLPTQKWKAELDSRLKEPNVIEQLQLKGFKGFGQKKN